ncbi:hypothetical protein TraAM80_05965 [Trypanosoma rangeli]|uniref:Ras-GEF domain-containing protein n=1 Tax=Trypanosoma rangeli TaxID=5698 RepID=A0A3R7LTL9_TRYRA|nr:uncharacterized protein TraAM80_05965 [Trypanosoma rangeli]RNF03087.1 hypothetical protein TraAM80_05965 [Trypanosoma rangeli]|eukprot:RNF03087.1 hypothetical protein TraAM80_05965 [Trypanosoma rangeli]
MRHTSVVVSRFVGSSPTEENTSRDVLSSPLSPPPPPPSTGSDEESVPEDSVLGSLPRALESVVRKLVRRPGVTNYPSTVGMQAGDGDGVWQCAATPPMMPDSTDGRSALTLNKLPLLASPYFGSDVETTRASDLAARYPYYNSHISLPTTTGNSQKELRRQNRSLGDGASPMILQTATDNIRAASLPPLTVVDMNQAIEQCMQECQRAMSPLTSSMPFIRVHKGECVGKVDTAIRNTRLVECLREVRMECGANSFVAAFLSANGYNEALRSFRMHLPLAEQQLQSFLYHQRKQQQQRQGRCLVTTPSVQQGGQEVLPSPEYAMTNDDLLLLVMETVRRKQLLNDSLPWRDVNCQRNDYRLESLRRQKTPQENTPTSPDSGVATSFASAIGGSLDLLIEVLILVETDIPFTTGMPLMNYTNTFIVLASLFVMPEVLIVRLIRLFRHVQQDLILDHSRRVFLQRRIVQFMTAYCSYHEADVTSTLLERLRLFLQKLCVTPPVGHSARGAEAVTCGEAKRSTADTQEELGGFLFVHAEVAPSLNELSAFVELTLEKMYMASQEGGSGVCWQRHLTALVRPLGTILKTSNQQSRGAEDVNSVQAAFHKEYLKKKGEHQAEVAFTVVSAETLAMQLCLLSFKLFADIRLRELLNNAWCDEVMRMSVPNYLLRLIDYSSHVQRWTTAVIVSPARWSECQKAMTYVIRLCRCLCDQQNYEMASAVLGGLQHPAVVALEDLYQGRVEPHGILGDEEQRELTALQNLMDPFASQESPSSFSCISSRASEESQAPMIPLLAPLLGVLFRTEEVRGRTVELFPTTGLPVVNWTKIMAISKTVFLWLRCQNTPYAYAPDATLQHYLWQLPGHLLRDATLMGLARQKRQL